MHKDIAMPFGDITSSVISFTDYFLRSRPSYNLDAEAVTLGAYQRSKAV